MKPYPLLPEPLLKPRVWGGRELARFGKKLPENTPIGESWEVADLPETIRDGRSVIANGALAGRTLRQAITEHTDLITGRAALTDDGGFPLLIKYLDARQNLSVQVHPTADYVKNHPEASLKSEAWIVIDAVPGAVIYKGVRADVTPGQFARDIETDAVVDDLLAVPVQPGDCHYLPTGTCHALGAGVIVAEVQTPSDTTFRVYDWGRTGRELHLKPALQCIRFGHRPMQPSQTPPPIEAHGTRSQRLLDTEYFTIDRVQALAATSLEIVTNDMPVVWMVIQGRGTVRGGGIEETLRDGTTVIMPAAMQDGVAQVEPGCYLLIISPPSPIKGMIA